MFLNRKEGKKLHKGSVLVGYDLGEQYSQISYCIYGQEDVDTVATVVGTKQYNIPTMLCKRKGVNQWFYGKDAVKNAGEEDMVPVEDLLALAGKGEDIELDGESYDPVALLTLFVRRSMALMNFIAPVEKVDAIMFTVEEPDDRMVEILSQVSANMGLRTSHIYFQSHTESFYAFVLHQPAELWYHQVIACEHDGLRLKIYRMECNKRTTPVVVLIEEQMYETLVIPGEDEEETLRQDAYQLADERFLGILQSMCEGRMVSSVYLLGDGFRAGWQERSLKFLCHNRRVFQGNNLFSRGACYGLLEKLEPSEEGKSHVFLGKDMLKANIGMHVMRQGKESYYALLDAGGNWYEQYKECDLLLTKEKQLQFVVTPLNGKNAETKVIPLTDGGTDGVPFTRYHMEMKLAAPDKVLVKVTDLGFGEFFAPGGRVWEESFQIG
ncbi:MAG: hypothetical protein K2P22_00625 [Lachnospiraceae bacterium]|nr:hypothetical protein [Lachnospiraceae bacterium]